MNAGEIAEYAVGILVPLGMFCGMEKRAKALRILLVEARRIRSKEGVVAPASIPLFESVKPCLSGCFP